MRTGFCVVLLLLIVVPARAQAPLRLSVAEATSWARARSPEQVAGQARVLAADAKVAGARRQPNPTLALAHGFGSKETGGLDEDILLSQTVELGPTVRHRTRAAQAERDAAQAALSGTGADLDFAVRAAYVEALRADAETGQARRLLASTRRFAEAAQVQFDAGDAPRSNVVRSQIEVSRAEQTLQAATADRDTRYDELRSLLGIEPGTPLDLTDPLAAPRRALALPALIELALKQRPELIAARRLTDARAADIRSADAQRQPNLIVEARRAALDRSRSGESVRLGVEVPLLDYGRVRAEVRGAQAARSEQEALLREAERVAKLEVGTAFREYTQALALVDAFEQGRLTRAREILEMVETGYGNGASAYLEVIDAQRVFQSEQVDYARALAAAQTAAARLERAVGGKLP